MYTPVLQTTIAFMRRYVAIMNGDEIIDTPQKLKDFWLFTAHEGWKSYEMREYTAELAIKLSDLPPSREFIHPKTGQDFWLAYDSLYGCQSIWDGEADDKETANIAWRIFQSHVENIKIKKNDLPPDTASHESVSKDGF